MKQPKRKTRAEKEKAPDVVETIPMGFDSPESSLIEWAQYSEGDLGHILLVKFKTGKTYSYSGISNELWIEFYRSASKGQFFGQRIRPLFVGIPHV